MEPSSNGVAAGVSIAEASRATGLREKTVKDWLTKGRRKDGTDYADFAERIDQARSETVDRPEPRWTPRSLRGSSLKPLVAAASRR